MAGGKPWTKRETVIALYFQSRGFDKSIDVASEVIELRRLEGDVSRLSKQAQSGVARAREAFGTYGLTDPYDKDTKEWDRVTVGKWLATQMDKEELEDLLGVKGKEIKNEKVQEIVNNYV